MISVVLSRPRGPAFASWVIRKLTNSDVSHASIHHPGQGFLEGTSLVFEATAHGLGMTTREKWDTHNQVLYRFDLKDLELGYAGLRLLYREAGSNYDYGGVGRFAWYLFWERISLRIAQSMVHSTPDTMFCSEAVARWIQFLDMLSGGGRFQKLIQLEAELTAPEHLKALRFCEEFEVPYANPDRQ